MNNIHEATKIKRLCASVVASFDSGDWTILQSMLPSGRIIKDNRVISCLYCEDDEVYLQVVASVLAELAKANDGSLEGLEKYLSNIAGSSTDEMVETDPSTPRSSNPMVFISHKAEEKLYATMLKEELGTYGIEAFVAHEDIQVTAEWAVKIEEALSTCDALAYIATSAANGSMWCQQEVGWAFGRGIPIVPFALGDNPTAFLGRRQAMRISTTNYWGAAAKSLVDALLISPRTMSRTVDALVDSLASSTYFDMSNLIADALEHAPTVSRAQASAIEAAIENNSQVSGASHGTLPNKLRSIIANTAGERAI